MLGFSPRSGRKHKAPCVSTGNASPNPSPRTRATDSSPTMLCRCLRQLEFHFPPTPCSRTGLYAAAIFDGLRHLIYAMQSLFRQLPGFETTSISFSANRAAKPQVLERAFGGRVNIFYRYENNHSDILRGSFYGKFDAWSDRGEHGTFCGV